MKVICSGLNEYFTRIVLNSNEMNTGRIYDCKMKVMRIYRRQTITGKYLDGHFCVRREEQTA